MTLRSPISTQYSVSESMNLDKESAFLRMLRTNTVSLLYPFDSCDRFSKHTELIKYFKKYYFSINTDAAYFYKQ